MEDPILNNDELAKQIKSGEYTVPQKPGALSPAQFNMAQGMTAAQSDGIEVLITDNAGETKAMGLVEYTLSASEGTAVEDAKQEGQISINFTKDDNELWSKVSKLTIADAAEYRTFSFATYSSLEPVYVIFPAGSISKPDGILKRFKSASPQLGKVIDVYHNGNFQGASTSGMYEFDVAPAEHDVVEFVGEARDCELEIKSIESAITAIDAEMAKTESEKNQLEQEINDELLKATERLATEKAALKSATDSEASSILSGDTKSKEMSEGENVNDVERLRDLAIGLYKEAREFSVIVGSADLSVKNTNVQIDSLNVDKAELNNAYAAYVDGADDAKDELTTTKEMLDKVVQEWKDFDKA